MSDKLAEDWVALWQSELTAMAADRELRESWAAIVALWASATNATIGMMTPRHDQPYGTAFTAQPPRTPAAHAAPVPGVDEVANLNRRIAELEQRLAALDRNGLAAQRPSAEPPKPGD
jgi:hypothetical protein